MHTLQFTENICLFHIPGRKKKKKLLMPLLLLLKLKAATLIPMVLGTLALLSFKALLLGKVALLISGLIALKKLFHQEPNSQTFEVSSIICFRQTGFDLFELLDFFRLLVILTIRTQVRTMIMHTLPDRRPMKKQLKSSHIRNKFHRSHASNLA